MKSCTEPMGPEPEGPEPRYSVIIASRNEGDSLRRTVESLLVHAPSHPFEVVIVDDASGDGSATSLEELGYAAGPVRIARSETRQGLIRSRARAAGLARGRYLACLDAHCAVGPGWLEGLEAALDAAGGEGIAVPVISGLSPSTWTIDRGSAPGAGCTLVNPFLDFFWAEPVELDGRLATPIASGGAWMMRRAWYDHIGGLDAGMVAWGGENVDLSLRTWLAGGWCVVAGGTEVGHLFRTGPAHPASRADIVFNKIRAAHNALSRETFHQVMLRLAHLSGFREAHARALADRAALGEVKRRFEAVRKRSDRWLIDALRLPLLEPPFFYRVPVRRPLELEPRRRPRVSVVVAAGGEADGLDGLLAGLIETTSYGNSEVVVVGETRGDGEPPAGGRWRDHPRLRFVTSSRPLGGGLAENLWALASDAEYCAFLDASIEVIDPHWLERMILLFEQRTRLLLASPRLRDLDAAGEARGDVFDAFWDLDAPGFSRERAGRPLAEAPYQALSSPAGALVVHRARFVELGGFDPTARAGRPVLDLAIRGWLCGHEVFCHPGVVMGRRPGRAAGAGAPPGEREYAEMLPVAKCFTSAARIESCRRRRPRAEPLLAARRAHLAARRAHLAARRRELLARARFDDDWLFYKFGIEEDHGEPEVPA